MSYRERFEPVKPASAPLRQTVSRQEKARAERMNLANFLVVKCEEKPEKDAVFVWMKIPPQLQGSTTTAAQIADELRTYLAPAFTESAWAHVTVTEDVTLLPIPGLKRDGIVIETLKGPALKLELSGQAAEEFRTQYTLFSAQAKQK